MANKLKREAAEAFEQLRDYLSRDKPAQAMLAKLDRYMGELRQAKSLAMSEYETTRQALAGSRKRSEELDAEVLSLKRQLDTEFSLRKQAEASSALDRKRLEDELAAQFDVPIDADWDLTEKRFWQIARDLQRGMRVAPAPMKRVKSGGIKMQIYDLRDFVPNFTDEEFKALGQFITLGQVLIKVGWLGCLSIPERALSVDDVDRTVVLGLDR